MIIIQRMAITIASYHAILENGCKSPVSEKISNRTLIAAGRSTNHRKKKLKKEIRQSITGISRPNKREETNPTVHENYSCIISSV